MPLHEKAWDLPFVGECNGQQELQSFTWDNSLAKKDLGIDTCKDKLFTVLSSLSHRSTKLLTPVLIVPRSSEHAGAAPL